MKHVYEQVNYFIVWSNFTSVSRSFMVIHSACVPTAYDAVTAVFKVYAIKQSVMELGDARTFTIPSGVPQFWICCLKKY